MNDEFDYRDMYSVPTNKFAVASLACGIIAIITFASLYFPVILGSLAIIFAFLSRNGTRNLAQYSKIGIVCGSIAVVGVIATVTYWYIHLPDLLQNPTYRDIIQRILNNAFGGDVDLEKFFGIKDTSGYLFRLFI